MAHLHRSFALVFALAVLSGLPAAAQPKKTTNFQLENGALKLPGPVAFETDSALSGLVVPLTRSKVPSVESPPPLRM